MLSYYDSNKSPAKDHADGWAALVTGEKSNFQFILRLLNTNVDGRQKIMYALTKIKGVGRRYSNLVCKKADVDLNKRCVPHAAGNLPEPAFANALAQCR